MTVKELIEKLQTLPPDLPVAVIDNEHGPEEVDEVDLERVYLYSFHGNQDCVVIR